MFDRDYFFRSVRANPFGRALTQSKVDGLNAILDAWDASKLTDKRWLAYMLATTFHETAKTMQPIREYGRGKGKRYGTTYYGRGFVQLTWKTNYQKAKDLFGADFIGNPDLALDPGWAAKIMFSGMTDGWFTGKKLADYISGTKCDYVNARRIINGTDKAALIADYARGFEAALKGAAAVAPAPVPIPVTADDPGPDPDPVFYPSPAPSGGVSASTGAAAVIVGGGLTTAAAAIDRWQVWLGLGLCVVFAAVIAFIVIRNQKG